MFWFTVAFAAAWLSIMLFWVWKLWSPQAAIAGVLVTCGAFGFFGTALLNGSDRIVPTSVELPNAAPRVGVAIDSRGHIYVGSEPLGRIQTYDRSGTYLFAILPDTRGGTFSFHVDETDRVHVLAVRPRSEQVYGPDGALLETVLFEERGLLKDQRLHAARAGMAVRADWLFVMPRVVIEDGASGDTKSLIPNLALLPLFSPLHGWLLAAIGVGWLVLLRARRKRSASAAPALRS
jgi:hypothetical protein